jgi:wyosine [tRNA(Phe)-imidazoG37] synthetase (radical SAM superfamily)
MKFPLTTKNHDRDSADLQYVYPVISRRSGGLSVGINFNTNNACNWRCIYCQVPNLIKGVAPNLDLQVLQGELELFLRDVQHGDFYERFQVEPGISVIKDIAISGNGEPTSAKKFAEAISLIGDIATTANVFPGSHFVLITNGSLIHQQPVRDGLKILKAYGGEVWFKLDSATKAGRYLVNQTVQSVKSSLDNIKISAELCPTKIQTCFFGKRGLSLSCEEKQAYLEALKIVRKATDIEEIMLYTLARPSMQPDAADLLPLPLQTLDEFAGEIRQLGFAVSVSS